MTPKAQQILLLVLVSGALLWLASLDRKRKKEKYIHGTSSFLTGTYEDIKGMTRMELCQKDCKEWLTLPPFDTYAGFCFDECSKKYGMRYDPVL